MPDRERVCERTRVDRRRLLKAALRIGLAVPAAGAVLGSVLTGCGRGREEEAGAPEPEAPPAPAPEVEEPASPGEAAPPAAEPGSPPAPGGGERPLVTEVPAMEATVQTLQYTNESPHPDQQCSNCQFYTAAGGGLGRCQLFTEGYVREGGWCQSWTATQT